MLLGREPKDFDVATNASPEEVEKTFSNCRLIGRRFRLAHVRFGREIIEVATFRGPQPASGAESASENGMILRDNVFGTIEEDALRRDFTVNALFYSIDGFSVIDYANGMEDLEKGLLRLLGDPETRYREDPVRMLRAVRFAAKLGFQIEETTRQPIHQLAGSLAEVPAARLFEEVLKMFLCGCAVSAFEKLRQHGLFAQLFPATEEALAKEDHHFPLILVEKGLENTDRRIAEGKPVTPAFLFAVLLWEPVRLHAENLQAAGMAPYPAFQEAASRILERQQQRVSIPKRFSVPMREIWTLQSRLKNTRGKRPHRLLEHQRFRAAYDFLLLRAESGEADPALGDWWTKFQEEHGVPESKAQPRRKPRRRRRGNSPKDAANS